MPGGAKVVLRSTASRVGVAKGIRLLLTGFVLNLFELPVFVAAKRHGVRVSAALLCRERLGWNPHLKTLTRLVSR